ncbi:hypothetical protein R9X50_00799500 [Acrodontium crateriforme]|uniref:GST N-terminal domain-containing protein n=1 Tax=Acrodontium crateriforme TaxID=150365 RepID=A0AAQ3MC06_9PEZI|nr:hypothetical protein R9X50_00799500 [Acrodontium crateriforme]
MATGSLPSSWHSGPEDAFHGKITPNGLFKPEKGRYHLYIGLFCPFAHRANVLVVLKQLQKYAGIETSIVKPYPKGDDNGWPGWQFNLKSDEGTDLWYEGATDDKLFDSKFMHEVYFKADKDFKGRYSVPVLWDKKLGTIVNNDSLELLRDLQTGFNSLLPPELQEITLYPEDLRNDIDRIGNWMQRDLNTGVYKVGFNQSQEGYEKNLPAVFAALNKLEKITHTNKGPYILGKHMTELDVRAYATLIRFDTVYVQHFKCNLGMLRYSYPVLNNWLKNMYWNHSEFKDTTDFRHIKENYTKSHPKVNPLAITPVGPWPSIEKGYEADFSKLVPGEIDMPEVLEYEKKIE